MKMKSRRYILAIALIASMGLGAYSMFTDYATVTRSGEAGTLDIDLADATEDLTAGLTIMNPGDSNPIEFTVENTGEKSVDVRAVITVTTFDSEGEPLAMTEAAHEYQVTDENGTELNGDLVDNVIVYTVDDVTLNGSIETEDGITETEHDYKYKFVMSPDAGNEWQGSSASVKIEVFAKQHRNTEDVGDGWTDSVEGADSSAANQSYSITYVTNGGAVPSDAADSYSLLAPVNLPAPTKEGYAFSGWYETEDLSGDAVTSTDGITGDKTFYASWTANGYTYNIVCESESGVDLGSDTITRNFGTTESVSAPVKTDYITPEAQSVSWDSTTAKTVTFTYVPEVYNITIDCAEGSGVESSTYTIESDAITLGTPERSGYDFTGWTGSNGTEAHTTVTIPTGSTGHKSYTANWEEAITYTAFTVTSDNRAEVGFTGADGENLVIPASFKDTNSIWYEVTAIGVKAFSCCVGLTSVTIPDSVTSIDIYAFGQCTGLTSVTIGNSVTSVGDRAFYSCSGLTSVTIPDSVTSIDDSAFDQCTGLTSVTIGNSVTTIGSSAFSGCEGLTSVTIPESVTQISNNAFASCSAISDVYYSGTEAQWTALMDNIGTGNAYLTSATIHYNSTDA